MSNFPPQGPGNPNQPGAQPPQGPYGQPPYGAPPPYGPPPGYGPPPYGTPYGAPQSFNPYQQGMPGQQAGVPMFGQPAPTTFKPVPPTSTPAIVSTIIGIFSMPVFCCWWVAVPLSLLGIILGHYSLSKISSSRGKLVGKPFAMIGLITSYLTLISTVTLTLYVLSLPPPKPYKMTGFDIANRKIDAGTFSGNNAQTTAMANEFQTSMTRLREEMFTKNAKQAFMSSDKFIVYCHQEYGSIVFLAQVPNYRNFNQEAKDAMAEMAWMVAQEAVEGKVPEGTTLAVGLRGTFEYGSVQVGKADGNDPTSKGTNNDLLEPYFAPPNTDGSPVTLPNPVPTPRKDTSAITPSGRNAFA